MISIEKTRSVPGLGKEGDWQPFDEIDPFNNIRVKGYLNREAIGKTYGALHIQEVDGLPCDQFIWPTPKQQYPFFDDPETGEMILRFPEISKVKVYEKLDGTNILAYAYLAPDGSSESECNASREWHPIVSYKTRLQPFMSRSFVVLWKEILVTHPDIPQLVLDNTCNLSFELYGRRNQNMVLYDTHLDAGLLFGVKPGNEDRDSYIIAPDELQRGSLTVPELIRTIDEDTDLVQVYAEIRSWLGEKLVFELKDNELDILGGLEGTVWYAYAGDELLQYKCKPEMLLDSTFTKSKSIPAHSIRTTVLNAFEDLEKPDYEYIVKLLEEEYSSEKIAKREFMIREILEDVTDQIAVRAMILEVYRKSGLDFTTQKNEVMRYIAQELAADTTKEKRRHLCSLAFGYLDKLSE